MVNFKSASRSRPFFISIARVPLSIFALSTLFSESICITPISSMVCSGTCATAEVTFGSEADISTVKLEERAASSTVIAVPPEPGELPVTTIFISPTRDIPAMLSVLDDEVLLAISSSHFAAEATSVFPFMS